MLGDLRLAQAAAAATPGVHSFRSRGDIHPPVLDILHPAAAGEDEYLFLSPNSGPGQRGVMILGPRGDLVWFRKTYPRTAMNFRRALYRGEPVLTWWEGKADRGLGRGEHVIVDASYRTIARLPAGRGRQSDLHEFMLTPRGTAIVTSYEVRDADLSAVGGPARGQVVGGIVQELALPSGRVLFEWKSLDHVDVAESHAEYAGHAFDYFHVNSVDVDADGNLIVSARNTWAAYKVSRRTGRVLWRLGGKRSDFRMGPGTSFAWQHDVRHHDGGSVLTIFDNGAAPAVEPHSRVLVLALDRRARTARLVRQYSHPRRLSVPFMGNAQLRRNGNVVVGWGGTPYVSEFSRDGALRFDARLPRGGQNYRAFRFPWVGAPRDPPKAAVHDGRLYVSWNGATEVEAWRLEAGPRRDALAAAGTRRRAGFDTALRLPAGAAFARAVALGAGGRELGRSPILRARGA